MENILLIGAGGQVGHELAQCLPALGKVTALSRHELDLTQLDEIQAVVQRTQPTVIVNAAAYTAVDRAETEPELADWVNHKAPKAIAEAAQSVGAQMIHLSTDYVFGGTKSSPYLESDETAPIGVYGQSKRQGEVAVLAACDRALILRTAWVYGVYGKGNFVKTMLRLGRDREELKVVADQIGTPTWAKDIATTTTELLQKNQQTEQAPFGIYHFTNSGATSWYDFAIAIFEEARALGMPLQLKTVWPITTADYPTPAQRPAYSVLGWQKLEQALGHPAPHWRVSLRQMLKDYQNVEA